MAADQHLRRADLMATALTDVLKLHDAECTTLSWPLQADHPAIADDCASRSKTVGFTGVVVADRAEERQPGRRSAGPWR